jgi:mannonate dehydratase
LRACRCPKPSRSSAAWKESLRNLAAAGIEVVGDTFTQALDRTRTDLAHRRPTGATCMLFGFTDFAAFDIHVLKRPGARDDFPKAIVVAAAERFAQMDDAACEALASSIAFGPPGAAETLRR